MSGIPHGAEVSPQPALRLPGVEESFAVTHRTGRGALVGCLGILLVLVAAGVVAGILWADGFIIGACILGFLALIVLLVLRLNSVEYRKARKVLLTYTWQEWPARLVRSDPDEEDSLSGVELLGADGHEAYLLVLPGVLDEALGGHREGEPVWFAGDVRFGGVVAAAGGQGWKYLARRRQPGRERGSELADRTARATGLMPKGWQPS